MQAVRGIASTVLNATRWQVASCVHSYGKIINISIRFTIHTSNYYIDWGKFYKHIISITVTDTQVITRHKTKILADK